MYLRVMENLSAIGHVGFEKSWVPVTKMMFWEKRDQGLTARECKIDCSYPPNRNPPLIVKIALGRFYVTTNPYERTIPFQWLMKAI